MELITDPQSGDMLVVINDAGLGAAPLENGDISVQVKDPYTNVRIVTKFSPEVFKQVVEKFQAAYGSRIVLASDEEVRNFGRTDSNPEG